MNPANFKELLGLKDQKDLNMANNIWKMLDDMANSDPDQYNKFIEKNIKQGFEDAKNKKQQKEKPYKVKVKPGFSISMNSIINQKPMENTINQKVVITKNPWSQIRKKFPQNLKLILNVAHCDRIKLSKSKSTGKQIQKYTNKQLSDIEFFYYSLQGPINDKNNQNKYFFCMILSSKFYEDIMAQPQGKKTLMSLCLSYLQERLRLDKNPLLKLYNPDQYRRLAFYEFDRFTIEINEKNYVGVGGFEPQQFLLQKQIDIKREQQIEKQKSKIQKEGKNKLNQIKFKKQSEQTSILPSIKTQIQLPEKKKVLIEVLKEQQASSQDDNNISYQMKESETGYTFDFLLVGINSIKQVDLQMKIDSVRLRVKNKKQLLIQLKKPINQALIKAKFKKKQSTLTVDVPFK